MCSVPDAAALCTVYRVFVEYFGWALTEGVLSPLQLAALRPVVCISILSRAGEDRLGHCHFVTVLFTSCGRFAPKGVECSLMFFSGEAALPFSDGVGRTKCVASTSGMISSVAWIQRLLCRC